MDRTSLIKADVLILAGLRQKPTTNPETLLGELCMHIALTLREGGNVLLPCYPSGVLYDLLECISSHLDVCGLSSVPIFFISPAAEVSLAYSNILAEWLSDRKQSKVYLPEEPFPHAYLVKNGRLKYFKKVYSEEFNSEFRQPCIIFCGHPSLRFGDVVHFIEQWCNNPQHSLILTEPDFDCTSAIAPYQPLRMKVLYCPLDTSLNYSQANRLLSELQPSALLVPTSYTRPTSNFPSHSDLLIKHENGSLLSLDYGEVVRFPLKRRLVKGSICPALADRLMIREVKPGGLHCASVRAALFKNDNNLQILPLPDDKRTGSNSLEFGSLNLAKFLRKLKEENFSKVTVEQKNSFYIVHFGDSGTEVHLEENTSHVYSKDEALRRRIRDLLLACLPSI